DGPDRHPPGPAPHRRPLRCRPVQDPRGCPAGTGGHGHLADGHQPPPGAGAQHRGPGPRRARAALRSPGGLRGGAGQRRRHRLLGHRHLRADPRAQPAPGVRRVQQQVRPGREDGAVAGRVERPLERAGHATDAGGRERRGRLRLGAQRDVHRSDGAGAPRRRRRRRRAGAGGRHLGGRRPPRRPEPGRRLLLRSAEGLRLRRWPVARRDVTRGAGPGGRARRRWALDTRLLRPADRDRQQPEEPDLQHSFGRDAVPHGRAARLDERPGRSQGDGRPHHGKLRSPLRLGREEQLRDAVRRGAGRALAGGRHHRLRRADRRRRDRHGVAVQRHRGHRALPQARTQPAAGRDVPRRRPRRRRGTDRRDRLRRPAAL
ncbi:MAG: Phosphoserine aminotransferase, partial [uncultured Nocardioidaceae bacterium]